jgi:hypothetical protein
MRRRKVTWKTSGAGVVRIHLLNLKNRKITGEGYFKLKRHDDPGHIWLNF